MIHVAIINASTVVPDHEVETAVPAFQTQVHRDFAPVWGVDAEVSFVRHGHHPRSGAWWLVLHDHTNQADMDGLHELTNEGLPLGKIYAQPAIESDGTWTVTASHELLEMLVDPDVNLAAQVSHPDGRSTLYAYEVCDQCQDLADAYHIDGIAVSDFVYPAWFETFHRKHPTQLDHLKRIERPFQILTGGYAQVWHLGTQGGWRQVDAEEHPVTVLSSRFIRRTMTRSAWRESRPR